MEVLGIDKEGNKIFSGDDILITTRTNDVFNQKFGKAIKKHPEEGKVFINFSKEFASVFGCPACAQDRTAVFSQAEMLKIKVEEHLDIKIRTLFNVHDYGHIAQLNVKFSPEDDCVHSDCTEKAQKVILVNVAGTITPFAVCHKHACFDGNHVDTFPAKK